MTMGASSLSGPATATGGTDSPEAVRLSRRMVTIAAVSQNVAIGLTFGSFGTLVVGIERTMHVGRGLSTLGAALAILTMGLLSPFLGALMQRFGLRTLLMAGAVATAVGYAVAATATGIVGLLLAYAVFIGPGIALLGMAVPSALVANWFVAGRGRALGIVNMPLVVAALPPIAAMLMLSFGLRGTYITLAVIAVALVPLLLLVIDKPEQVGLTARGGGGTHDGPGEPAMGIGALIRTRDYWLLGGAAAILGGAGASLATHIVALAIGQGVAPPLAATLLSVLGGAGVLGSLGYGSLADRIGGWRALSLNAAIQAVLWLGLLVPMAFPLRMLLVAAIGLNSGGMVASIVTAYSQRFGPASIGGALGLWSLVSLPFTVAMPPLTGALYVAAGNYGLAFSIQIALFCVAAVAPWLGSFRRAKG